MSEETCLACCAPLPPGPGLRARDLMHGVPGMFEVRECSICGSGTTLPSASDAELAAYYPAGYAPFETPRGLVSALMHRVQMARNGRFPVAALKPGAASGQSGGRPGHILDVGCGRGDLGASLLEAGWRVSGIEPSPGAARVAARRGIEVSEGVLSTVALAPSTFDAAVFRHSLEHVVDPVADLRRVRAALRPGGRVAVLVPNWSSWQRRLFGDRWFPLELPRHRTHFTAAGLRAALSAAGFDRVEIRPGTPLITTAWSLQFQLAGRLLTDAGPRLLAGYLFSIPIAAAVRAIDLTLNSGDFLHAIATRP